MLIDRSSRDLCFLTPVFVFPVTDVSTPHPKLELGQDPRGRRPVYLRIEAGTDGTELPGQGILLPHGQSLHHALIQGKLGKWHGFLFHWYLCPP